jgi:hypothetical protein
MEALAREDCERAVEDLVATLVAVTPSSAPDPGTSLPM